MIRRVNRKKNKNLFVQIHFEEMIQNQKSKIPIELIWSVSEFVVSPVKVLLIMLIRVLNNAEYNTLQITFLAFVT